MPTERTQAVLQHAHRVLDAFSPTDREALWRRELDHVRALKNESRFDDALALIERTILPSLPTGSAWRTDFWLRGAECLTRTYRWQEAARWLDLAEANLGASRSPALRDQHESLLAADRCTLQLSRGLPDLAVASIAVANEVAARSNDHGNAWRAAFLELRVMHALDRREAARQALQRFEAKHRMDHALRIRAALAVLQDLDAPDAERSEALGWLEAAAADPRLSADERNLARTRLIVHQLDEHDFEAAAAGLDTVSQQLPAEASADERRLGLHALSLRHALDAGLPRETIAARCALLLQTWHEFLAPWSAGNVQRGGLGPMFFPEPQRALGELVRTHLQLDGPDEGRAAALQLVLELEQKGTMARATGAPGTDLAAIQQKLCGERSGVLAFLAARERTYAFAIERHAVSVFELPVGIWRLDRLSGELLRTIQLARAGGDRALVDAAAASLARALLPDELGSRVQRWNAVSIVGLETLGYVPFELLRLPNGHLLGLDVAVGYLPSMTIGVWLHDQRTEAPPSACARLVCIACPDAVPAAGTNHDVVPLPFTPGDADRLCAALPPNVDVALLRGADATLQHAALQCAAASLLSVIAHGVRDESRTDPQGVLLGDGQTAWVADFERLTLPRHVVLGSCRAGRGRLRRGDDGRHLLGGAMLLAGARSVIVPWLDVDYGDTLALVAALHSGVLRDGLPMVEALRRARIAVAGPDGSGSIEPFLFHLNGLGDEPIAVPAKAPAERTAVDRAKVLLWAGALAALAVLAWALHRRRRGAP